MMSNHAHLPCRRAVGNSRRLQDSHALLERRTRPLLEFVQGATADRVVDHREPVVRNAEGPRDVAPRHLERVGADHQRGLAKLFERDAVMHTAR